MPGPSDNDPVDIVVLGGGIAGAVAAIGFTRASRRVALITTPRARPVTEGISTRAQEGLRFAACERALATVGPWVDRFAHWNGEQTLANGENLVDRQRLDAALVEDARHAGVQVRAGRVDGVSETPEGWRVGAGDAAPVQARFLVEARGRSAPARGMRRQGPAATALVRRWGLPKGAPALSAVASFADGWCWFAHPGDLQADLQVVVAGDGLPSRSAINGFYQDRVGEIPEAREWLEGAEPDGDVMARNANIFICDDIVSKQSITIGDAAHGLDPLSGHGQFQAISTALNAVAVVNTLLDRPGDGDLARRFYSERVEQAFLSQSRVGRDFYRLERRWAERPFWSARACWPDDAPAHPRPNATPPEVALRPVVEDGYIVERELVVTADYPRGIWLIDGVPLVSLMRFLDQGWRQGGDLALEAATHLSCRSEQIETALGWLERRGLLLARDA